MDPTPSFLGGGAGNLLRPRITAHCTAGPSQGQGSGNRKRSFTRLGTGLRDTFTFLFSPAMEEAGSSMGHRRDSITGKEATKLSLLEDYTSGTGRITGTRKETAL